MVEPPTEYNQLADFTHRPFRPDLEPHFSPKGIGLGTDSGIDPRKMANLLGKVAAKSKGGKGKPTIKPKIVISHGVKR